MSLYTPPRSGEPVTVATAPRSLPSADLVAGGYGNALPVVYGTAKVPGQMAFIGTGLGQRVKVDDVFTRDGSGSWHTTTGFVAPVEMAFCQGPVTAALNWWRGSDLVPDGMTSLLTRNTVQVGHWEWHNGDGTETAWGYLTASALLTPQLEKVNVGIGTVYGTSRAITNIWAVDPTGSWSSDVRVDCGYSFGPLGGALAGPNIGPMTRVVGTPGRGQYSVTSGTYTFYTGDNAFVDVQFYRDFSQVPGYGATAGALRNTAHLRAKDLAMPDGNGFPNISAEVKGFCVNAPNGLDAHPADVLLHLLTNVSSGLGLSASQIEVDHGPDGLSASSYRTYCTAMGFYVSRAITSQEETGKMVQQLLDATNSRAIWSNGKLKVIPLGDTATGSFGYIPATNATILSASEFIVGSPGDDPITVQRTAQSDVFNVWPVEFNQRHASGTSIPVYETANVEAVVTDPRNAATIRRAPPTRLDWITNATHAWAISYLLGVRSLYVRNTYRFTLGPRWTLLEPGDLVSLTEPVMGLSGTMARIVSIEEREDGSLDLQSEEWPLGTGHPVQSVTQAMDGMRATSIGTAGYTTSYALQAQATASNAAISDLSNILSGSNNWDNIFPNPNAEGTASPTNPLTGPGWSNVKNVGTGSAYAGSSVHAIASDASKQYYEITNPIPVGPGNMFYIEAQVRKNADGLSAVVSSMDDQLDFPMEAVATTGSNGYIGLRYRDVNQVQLTQTFASTTSSAWTLLKASGTAPTNAVWAELVLGLDARLAPATGSEVWFDNIYARRMVAGDIVQFGTLSGNHLAAGSITADKISAAGLATTDFFATYSGTYSDGITPKVTQVLSGAIMSIQHGADEPAIKIAPAGIMIGNVTFDKAWVAGTKVSCMTIRGGNSSGAVSSVYAFGLVNPRYVYNPSLFANVVRLDFTTALPSGSISIATTARSFANGAAGTSSCSLGVVSHYTTSSIDFAMISANGASALDPNTQPLWEYDVIVQSYTSGGVGIFG